jgi:RHS repeat-associated protein
MKIAQRTVSVVQNAWFLLFIVLLLALPTLAQSPATGTPPFGSFGGGPDVINLANLNAHWAIPVINKPGRGMNFSYVLSYDSSVWSKLSSNGTITWQPVLNWGWTGQTEVKTGYISYTRYSQLCDVQGPPFPSYYFFQNFVYYDAWGAAHPFSGMMEYDPHNCDLGTTSSMTSQASDGTGLILSATINTAPTVNSATITTTTGQVTSPPRNAISGSSTATDRNGNMITSDGTGHFFDTLSSTTAVLTYAGSGTPSSPMTFSYTAPSGASASYTMKYTSYLIRTNFGCTGVTDYGTNGTTTANLVTEIDLPDWNATTNPNSKYTFTYEQTPSHSGFVTGRVASVILPTGGTITYTYIGGNNGITCADGSTSGLKRFTPDTGSNFWEYDRTAGTGAAYTTTITDPAGNQTQIQFQGIYETQRSVYQGSISGTPLWINTICYNGNTSNCPTTAVTLPIAQRRTNPQFGGTEIQSFQTQTYNNSGMFTEEDDYDWANGIPTTILKKTLITYASLGNIKAFRQQVKVQNGSGTTISQTNYNYDETTPTASSGVTQHTSVSGSRGNLTSINYPLSMTSHLTYYDTGSPNTSQDVNGASTTYNYSSNTASCQMAFPTSISEPLGMSRSFAWNCTGGVQSSATDENNQITSTTWNDPYFWRPAQVSLPDGGLSSLTYNSATNVTTTTKMNSTQNIVSTALLDNLGRPSQSQLNSDPQGVVYSATTYDALGRTASVSNPYRSTGDPTYGLTSYQYDALDRVTKVTLPDGSIGTVNFSSNSKTATDPAGKKLQATFDGLGRITQVTEDPGGLGFVTTYTYDALSNLTNVTQNGSRSRTFAYDALSRLTSETNPETGTITYGYDASGQTGDLTSRTAPAPNQTGTATVTTTYSHDALHRLTQKSYSDGTTLTAFFAYGQTTAWGTTLTNTVGRLTEQWTGTSCCATGGAEIFGYDPMGRIVVNEQYTPKMGYVPVNYSYDLAGNLLTTPNIGSYQTSYQYNAAGLPTAVTSSPSDSQHPATLATVDSALGYYPNGAIRKMTPGNGLTQTTAFNKNLELCRVNVNSSGTALGTCTDSIPSGNLQDFNYAFNAGSTDNGNVMSWTATGQQAFNRSYTYDPLNRLSTLNQSSGSATGCSSTFSLSWTYDAWGNRTDQNLTGGTCNWFHATVNSLNQLTGSSYQYDAAGNMTHDASHAYFYDAENRLVQVDGTFGSCSATTVCYAYDALGHRVETNYGSSQLDYLHNLGGNVIGDWATNPSGFTGWATGYVYLNGQLLAQYQGATTHFAHSDHLGSTRLLTGLNQAVAQNLDYLPFGELNSSDSGINTHKFTGDERDSETSLDHTWFRQYSSILGRWMHPDPAGLAAGDQSNPQSWNRYAYTKNNSLNAIDPSGMVDCQPGELCWALGGGNFWDGNPYVGIGGGLNGVRQPITITMPAFTGFYLVGTVFLNGFPALIPDTFTTSMQPSADGWTIPILTTTTNTVFFGTGRNSGRSGLTISGTPRNCSLKARIFNSTDFNFKEGLDIEVGELNMGISQDINLRDNSSTLQAEFGAFGVGFNAQRVTDPGSLVPDSVSPNSEFSGHVGPYEKNLATGETKFSTSKLLKLGFAVGGGVDISFDLNKFKELTASCQEP